MWLDAFKPKSEYTLNDGVPSVPCVPIASGANEYKDSGGIQVRNTEVNLSVPGVPQSNARNTGNTTGKNGLYGRCTSVSEHPCGFPAGGTSGTLGTPEKQHAPERNAKSAKESLALFRFDLVQSDIDAGHDAAELHRTNNMAWQFMQGDGMGFDEAIKLAAGIVADEKIAACEAAYVDVMALFKRINDNKP